VRLRQFVLDVMMESDHFERLGLPRGYSVDPAALERKYLERSRAVHPDHTGNDPASLGASAALNEAYGVLRDPFRRAEYLLALAGGPSPSAVSQPSAEFLEEMLELRMQIEEAKVAAAWNYYTPDLVLRTPFSRPIASEYATTSPFGTRRYYDSGANSYTGYHAGQDYGAPVGVPVLAPAVGIVSLAEPLGTRGNAVIIDHGRGVFTGYWHMSELKVSAGQVVHPGDVLGLVGNTGLSTGAHLHWEMRIVQIAVEPLQFLDEPIFPPAQP
jgi:murein DD-endopeptidase MepM/ murein hydrolase activator NlpD